MNGTASGLVNPRTLLGIAVFIAVVVGVGTLIGLATAPGAWYAGLEKPSFNPPSWLFAPVWTALYVMIAIAGWRTFVLHRDGARMVLWAGQMGLNWMWSPVFFGLHWLWPAFGVILTMLLMIVAFIGASWKRDRGSALLFVPYAAWVAFASVLNVSIASLN